MLPRKSTEFQIHLLRAMSILDSDKVQVDWCICCAFIVFTSCLNHLDSADSIMLYFQENVLDSPLRRTPKGVSSVVSGQKSDTFSDPPIWRLTVVKIQECWSLKSTMAQTWPYPARVSWPPGGPFFLLNQPNKI